MSLNTNYYRNFTNTAVSLITDYYCEEGDPKDSIQNEVSSALGRVWKEAMEASIPTYIFRNVNDPRGLPLSLEKSENLVELKKHPDQKVGEITYYRDFYKKAVYVETIKSHERNAIAGIGFFLMTKGISSSPSCRTTLFSEGSAVLFYCKLGFVPKFTCLASDEKTRQNAILLKRELIAAKRENRAPVWNIKMPMSLPESARRKWQVVALSDKCLQEVFARDQRIIKIIYDYFLDFSSSDFLPGPETSSPTDPNAYVFQTNTGKEVMAYHYFCPPNLKSVWSHKICADSKEVGNIEVKNRLGAPSKVKNLINFTHHPDHVDYIPGISFFLIKKTLESLADSDMSLEKIFAGTEESFVYWRLGFRFCKDEGHKEQMNKLEEEFARAQQENRKPQNCPVFFADLMLPEESRVAWRFILKIDPILQEIFKKKQKITQIIEKYLL